MQEASSSSRKPTIFLIETYVTGRKRRRRRRRREKKRERLMKKERSQRSKFDADDIFDDVGN